jgi:hypothetical protein
MPLSSPPLEPTAMASSPAARRGAAGQQAGETAIGLTRGRWVAEDWPGVLPASSGGGPVVARPRVLEFQRGRGQDRPMCCTGSFTRV